MSKIVNLITYDLSLYFPYSKIQFFLLVDIIEPTSTKQLHNLLRISYTQIAFIT